MAILGNYKNNYDTETTTANNSMGFDPSAIQSCLPPIPLVTSQKIFSASLLVPDNIWCQSWISLNTKAVVVDDLNKTKV